VFQDLHKPIHCQVKMPIKVILQKWPTAGFTD